MRVKKKISFRDQLWISKGSKRDWPYFARWHYRGHNLGFVKQIMLLWDGEEPVGICVFCSPPLSLRQRNRFFQISGKWTRLNLKSLNQQIVMLSRIVLHPKYRGAGIASEFIRKCCELTGYPWIETLSEMGNINPFFEKAGFVRVGKCSATKKSRKQHSAIYGGNKRHEKKRFLTEETWKKSEFAQPVYFIYDNRSRESGRRNQTTQPE